MEWRMCRVVDFNGHWSNIKNCWQTSIQKDNENIECKKVKTIHLYWKNVYDI